MPQDAFGGFSEGILLLLVTSRERRRASTVEQVQQGVQVGLVAAGEVGGQAGSEPGGEEAPAAPFDDRAGRRRRGCWNGGTSAHVCISDRRAAGLTRHPDR